MNRFSKGTRLTAEEKGKTTVSRSFTHVPRVKASDFDNSDLVKKHSLTLVGRVTNQKKQRIWSLIPFLSDLWKTSQRAIGSELGQGCFQFQFSCEADLQMVLDNRPYHFARWMVILQRWEPVIDSSFPSQIPFWIRVQGIPLHLWSEVTLQCIGSSCGTYLKSEITGSAARMRVTINGLRPLIKQIIVEFTSGEEVTAQLVYEKLEKHCFICFKLGHEDKDCTFSSKTGSFLPETNRQDQPFKSHKRERRTSPSDVRERRSGSFASDSHAPYHISEFTRSQGYSSQPPSPDSHHSYRLDHDLSDDYQRLRHNPDLAKNGHQHSYRSRQRMLDKRSFRAPSVYVWREKTRENEADNHQFF